MAVWRLSDNEPVRHFFRVAPVEVDADVLLADIQLVGALRAGVEVLA